MIEDIEQAFVWIVWDHPAMGIESMPLRAYSRECDADASMGTNPLDDFYVGHMALIEDGRAYFFPNRDSNLECVPLCTQTSQKTTPGSVGSCTDGDKS